MTTIGELPPSQIPPQMRRYTPMSDLDFNLAVTETVWENSQIAPELKAMLIQKYTVTDSDGAVLVDDLGRPVIHERALTEMMSYYTRDLRFGNLDRRDEDEARYYLALAGDLVKARMKESFITALSRVTDILELSQSRKGFFRKHQTTLRSENTHELLEPPKNKLFFGKRREG